MSYYPSHLLRLVNLFKKLPGVGARSAERFAFELLQWKEKSRSELVQALAEIEEKLSHCSECGCLIEGEKCPFCSANFRETHKLCIVAHSRDLFTIEDTKEFKGLYHVLGGLLSPLDSFRPESLRVDALKKRIQEKNIQEVILALDSTIEGDTTSLFLKKELEGLVSVISRLAFGIPMGSSLDYVDGGTLAKALSGRKNF